MSVENDFRRLYAEYRRVTRKESALRRKLLDFVERIEKGGYENKHQLLSREEITALVFAQLAKLDREEKKTKNGATIERESRKLHLLLQDARECPGQLVGHFEVYCFRVDKHLPKGICVFGKVPEQGFEFDPENLDVTLIQSGQGILTYDRRTMMFNPYRTLLSLQLNRTTLSATTLFGYQRISAGLYVRRHWIGKNDWSMRILAVGDEALEALARRLNNYAPEADEKTIGIDRLVEVYSYARHHLDPWGSAFKHVRRNPRLFEKMERCLQIKKF
ncbi:MAG: hypothetical protein PHS53_03525 [Candidatus Pacebacteria bacterium]|nr:hypothetical protein [Candidatus Paceibacterota bacterium]MDD5357187.1 hypothetical protein [Candidatus Paceibacterota bacterium]